MRQNRADRSGRAGSFLFVAILATLCGGVRADDVAPAVEQLFQQSLDTLDQSLKGELREKILKLAPDSAYGHFVKAWKIYKTDPRQAFAEYAKAIELKPDLWAAYYNRGKLYDDLHDYNSALTDYRTAAEHGYAGAQAALGSFYRDGKAVLPDDRQAAFWIRKSAEQGNPGGQMMLGELYVTGKGVPLDPAQGFKWSLLAAQKGEPTAQFDVSGLYEMGHGVAFDHQASQEWLKKSAALGFVPSRRKLGYVDQRSAAVAHFEVTMLRGIAQEPGDVAETGALIEEVKAGRASPPIMSDLGDRDDPRILPLLTETAQGYSCEARRRFLADNDRAHRQGLAAGSIGPALEQNFRYVEDHVVLSARVELARHGDERYFDESVVGLSTGSPQWRADYIGSFLRIGDAAAIRHLMPILDEKPMSFRGASTPVSFAGEAMYVIKNLMPASEVPKVLNETGASAELDPGKVPVPMGDREPEWVPVWRAALKSWWTKNHGKYENLPFGNEKNFSAKAMRPG